jgi:general secretion pathway protein G
VEVLAVVVILGLLAGTLYVGFSGTFGRAKHELARTGIGIIVSKLEVYRIETGTWPSDDLRLQALTDGQATPADAYYLSGDKLSDPWGREYHFITPGPDGHPFEVISYGADGQPGGEGEEADVSSVYLSRDRDE